MKRALRISIRILTLPFVIFTLTIFYIVSLCFVFYEWLFEKKDKFYSHSEHHSDVVKDMKMYFKNFFR